MVFLFSGGCDADPAQTSGPEPLEVVLQGDAGSALGWALLAADDGVLVGAPGTDQLWQGQEVVLTGARGTQAGFSLAQGDFDGDGHQDLVVGAPGFGLSDQGEVAILTRSETFTPAGESWDRAGWALATVRGGNEKQGDALMVGLPGADGHGAVVLLSALDRDLSEARTRIESVQTTGLGSTVATGDFNGDGIDDFALADQAAVTLVDGPRGGPMVLEDVGVAFWPGCGGALLIHDLDQDGLEDLVVGCPDFDHVAIVRGITKGEQTADLTVKGPGLGASLAADGGQLWIGGTDQIVEADGRLNGVLTPPAKYSAPGLGHSLVVHNDRLLAGVPTADLVYQLE